jgi:hypothetical protein
VVILSPPVVSARVFFLQQLLERNALRPNRRHGTPGMA